MMSFSERILILTRTLDRVSEPLWRHLSKLGKVEIIVDCPPSIKDDREIVWIPDEEAQGYEYLMSDPRNFSLITSWSRAFVHLSRTLQKGEAVWFVEDDVAGDPESFRQLVLETARVGADLSALEFESAAENPDWIWFPTAEGFFKRPWRSFNPLCRLSEDLIRKIMEFREHHERMTFHEVLFASIADENGMPTLNWQKDIRFKHLVANFRYRPIIRFPVQGVCHPVKDLKLMNLLCEAPTPEFPRMSLANLSGYSILLEDYVFLSQFSRKMGFQNIVEFGPGSSTLAFRDAGCKVTSYEHELKWLEKARQILGDDPAVDLRFCGRGDLPNDDEPAEAVDLVFVDGPTQIEGDEMARLRICEWAMSKHGIFLLHDAKRETETAILEIFKERGVEALEIPTRKGMFLVFDKQRCAKLVELAPLAVTRWPRGECLAWEILVKNSQPMKMLALGGNEEKEMIAAVKGLFTHPESSFHHVVKPDGEPSLDSLGDGVEIYEGESVEVLSWMIATEGHWESFDFVLIDQEISPFDLLSQACQVWPLLKTGGMLGFSGIFHDESVTDCSTIDDLIKSLGEQVQVVLKGQTCVLLKLGV